MNAVPNDAHYFNIHKRFYELQLEDFWKDNSNLRITDDDEFNLDSSISQSINCATSAINPNLEEVDSEIVSLLEKNYGTCQVIVELIQKLPEISWFTNG